MHHPTGAKPSLGWWPILCLLFSATMWGVLWYPLRLLEVQGLQGLWTTLIMYGATLLPGLLLIRGRFGEFARAPGLLTVLAVASGWCNVAFILAVLEGSVVRVLLLFYLSPLWASVLGYLFLGERMSRFSLATLGLAMVGAFVVLWHPDLGMPWPRDGADWLAISSGFAFAVNNALVRKAQHVSVQVKTMAAWLGVVGLAAIGLVLVQSPLPQVSAAVLVGAVMLGMVGMVLMTLAVQYGVTHMPVYRSSVILLFEIVAGAVSSLLLSDEVVRWHEWMGGALIMLAAYLSARAHLQERTVTC